MLADLELATSKYELIAKLLEMKPGDLDALNTLLADWSIQTTKLALDEITQRLKLTEALDLKNFATKQWRKSVSFNHRSTAVSGNSVPSSKALNSSAIAA